MLNQEYVPCNKQIHIKLSEEDLERIHDRMKQIGVRNMSGYIRKMAIDGYYIHVEFKELLEVIRLMRIDSNNINQIAKVANSCGAVDGKIISDMKAEHEKVLKKVEKCFDKYLEIM
ncbi:plasmid mobilization protein [Pseudobutyrivibrio xylanivorans]|uniref:Mobilisation protein (MobC) n=1 Tax=Pseudobutyrivibrio xylanivorans TaxID=185007 RepID=A0A1G5S0X4_PSEXY|nr:plasmid mobilization relaxosome protein MobC [Pseudobutyrivibrio xylanivorans]SCZ79209.1 mobilisation protein (MobC) [Pseudobutyrivibrio xylanivorans]